MAVIRWDPFSDVAALQNRINRMFEEAFGRSRDLQDDGPPCDWQPAVDIYETAGGIVLAAELPGVGKEDVAIEVKDNVLTLKGKRVANPAIQEKDYYHKERCFGAFQRSFTLQQNVQPELIKATFKDGVLLIEIPRPEEEKPKQITVDIQ